MTISTLANSITYSGNGATTVFAIPFALPTGSASQVAAQLVVTTVAAGITTTIPFGPSSSQYQLSVNAAIAPNPTPVGGAVTYNPLGVPIPNGTTLTITRILSDQQSTSLNNQGTLLQSVVESALDYLMMTQQQQNNGLALALTAPVTDPPGLSYVAPAVAARAGTFMGWDAFGNVNASLPAGSTFPISAAMAPVVNAATIAAALALLGLTGAAPEPTGVVKCFAGAAGSIPAGYLICGGQAVSRSGANAALFALLGTTYGVGDGSTTFNVPDLRGRVIAGLDNMGGVAANRLTATTITGGATTLGNVGAFGETNTITIGKMPAHSHTQNAHNHVFTGQNITALTYNGGAGGGSTQWITPGGGITGLATDNATAVNQNTGGGNPFEIVQPTIVLNYIIKL